MDRINGAGTIDIGAGRRGFRDENLDTGIEGTEVTALWLNMLQEEIASIIEGAGMVLDPVDWTQLGKALQRSRSTYAEAGGAANAVTATLSPAPVSLAALIGVPVRLKMAFENTTAVVTLNLNGLGAIAIRDIGETTLPTYAWAAGEIVEFIFDGTYFRRQNYLGRSGGLLRSPNAAKILIDMIMAAGQTAPPIRLRDSAGNERLTYDFTYGGLRVPNGLGAITTSLMLLAGATGSDHFTITDGNTRQQVEFGIYPSGGSGDVEITFPIAFKSGTTPTIIVTAQGDTLDGTSTLAFATKSVTNTGFQCARRFVNNGGSVGQASQGFGWLATGQV